MSDRLLNANEVAEILSVPVSWVREHTRGGLIPHVTLGRYVRYRRSAVLDWIADQETNGAAWRKHKPKVKRDNEACRRPTVVASSATVRDRARTRESVCKDALGPGRRPIVGSGP